MFADPQRAAAETIGALIENAAQGNPPDNPCFSEGSDYFKLPPGYVHVTELVHKHGLKRDAPAICSMGGCKPTNGTGPLANHPMQIKPTRWGMDGAERWLEKRLPTRSLSPIQRIRKLGAVRVALSR